MRDKRAIVPVWAQRIEVEKGDGEFLIHGWGHLPYYVDPKRHPDAHSFDLLERLRRYVLRQLKSRNGGGPDLGPYQFADATDAGQLENFLRAFGPVCGAVEKIQSEEGTSSFTATVRQSLEELRREQKLFAAAVGLLGEVNKNVRADPKKLADLMVQLAHPDHPQGPQAPSIWLRDRGSVTPRRMPALGPLQLFALAATAPPFTGKAPDKQKVIGLAHAALCHLLNAHSPVLVPASEQPIELPAIATEGIREALYYGLRLDYLAQRAIGTCLSCGGHFPITRRGQKGCSERCRRRLRNQRYRRTRSRRTRRAQ